MQYTYTLPPATERLLQQTPDAQMQRFQELGKTLLNENIWPLELGSTILFFHRQQGDWTEALRWACEFKKVSSNAGPSLAALALARSVHAQGRN